MPEDKELIRRALLGDKQAQEKCTAQGIVLPCPCCCASVDIVCVPAHEHKILDLPAYQGGCFIECTGCTYAISGENKKEVLKAHNTRPAPPVGRCGECAAYGVFKDNQCVNTGYYRTRQDFCSDFERREEE